MNFRHRLSAFDKRHSRRMQVTGRPGKLRGLASFFAHSGDSWVLLALLAGIWWWGSPFWKERALIFGVAIFITAAIVAGLKLVFRRQRPEGEWGKVYRATDPHSFPSGHATRAFMMAALGSGLGPGWLALLLWGWAPLVTLARVAMGVHYLLDVVAGIVLGLVLGVIYLVFV